MCEKHWYYNVLLEVLLWELRLILAPGYSGQLNKNAESIRIENKHLLDAITHINQFRKDQYLILNEEHKLGMFARSRESFETSYRWEILIWA